MLGGTAGRAAVAGRDDVGRCEDLGRVLPPVVGLLRLLFGLFPPVKSISKVRNILFCEELDEKRINYFEQLKKELRLLNQVDVKANLKYNYTEIFIYRVIM
jgi:hypothetical protein